MMTGSVRRRAAPLLIGYARNLSTTTSSQAAPAPALTEKPVGFLAKLFGSQRLDVPLTDELPDYQRPVPVGPPSSPSETQSTTLPNGLKVLSEASYGPTSNVGIFVDVGSIYETQENTGVTHLLEQMGFKSTVNRTSFRITRELEGLGAGATTSASREQLVYTTYGVRSHAAELVEILADSALNPKFNPWEVNAQIVRMEEDIKNFSKNTLGVLQEGMHAVAYNGALGRPLLCPEESLLSLSDEVLHKFVQEHFTANRIVVAGSGIEHQELVSLVEPLTDRLQSPSFGGQPPSNYVGGDFRQFKSDPLTHSAIAFEVQGGWRDVKASVIATVLQFLVGGGGSFSSGGPGKGMHSRLYLNVLNQHHWMQNCVCFCNLYNDTGIFGVTASAHAQYAGQSVDRICQEMLSLAKNVSKEELSRAKNAAVNQVLSNLESKAVIAEDIGRQVLTYGHRKPIKEFLDLIEALEPSDLRRFVQKLFQRPVTYGAIGDIANMPRYEEVSRRFKSS